MSDELKPERDVMRGQPCDTREPAEPAKCPAREWGIKSLIDGTYKGAFTSREQAHDWVTKFPDAYTLVWRYKGWFESEPGDELTGTADDNLSRGFVGAARNVRQKRVHDWCVAAFGAYHAASIPQRGIRHAEEAIESAQASGCESAMVHKLVDHVYSKPAGKLSQEIGGSGITLLALAEAAGVSADAEEARELARVLAKPLEHFAARNKAKNDAGFNVTGKPAEHVESATGKPAIACIKCGNTGWLNGPGQDGEACDCNEIVVPAEPVREYGIGSLIDGTFKGAYRDKAEAFSWVAAFPQSYRLVWRFASGPWQDADTSAAEGPEKV